ncbi:MAG: FMN-binding protein, partial [Acidobacteriota bacterium]
MGSNRFAAPVVLLSAWVAGVLCSPGSAWGQLPFGEQRYDYELGEVLPDAREFVRAETYWKGYDAGEAGRGERLVGYVFLTDDLVEIPGYSGQTLNTLVGMDTEGTITGLKIVRHSEPIVLIGLSEVTIHEFVAQYVGKKITERVIISDSAGPGYTAVDGISGATVTAVAENATVLEAGRLVARAEGIVKPSQLRRRRPSDRFRVLTWEELVARGAIGSITVRPEELGLSGDSLPVDLRFSILDPPAIGENLLGERFFAIVQDRLERDGGSAIYVGGNGALSFKGAGFARGGIFDRFLLEQAGDLFVVKDMDYINFP